MSAERKKGKAKLVRDGSDVTDILGGIFGISAVADVSEQVLADSSREELEKKIGFRVKQVTYEEYQARLRESDMSTKVVIDGQGIGKEDTSGWLDATSPIAYTERALFSFAGCVVDSCGQVNLFHFPPHVRRNEILKFLKLKGRNVSGGIVGSQIDSMKHERSFYVKKDSKYKKVVEDSHYEDIFVNDLGLQPIYSPRSYSRIDFLVDPKQKEILYSVTDDSEAWFFQSV